MKRAGRPSLDRTAAGHAVEGLVVRTESGFHRVLAGDRTLVCRVSKRVLGGERVATTAVVIGDHVRARPLDGDTGVIEEILPRDNELVRGAAGGSRFLDVIAANIDLMVVVHSLREPDLNPRRVDRFLLMAEAAEIPALVCLNKIDLATCEEAEEAAEPYRAAGYPVALTCAKTGAGIDRFRGDVAGKITTVVGPSGAGKSSLLNGLEPGLRLRTGVISDSTNKGRHTTTTAELIPLRAGGWIADTPGLRELAIRDVEPEDLAWLFPEFRPYLSLCRFSDCSHRVELGCAVRAAVEEGELSPARYESYLRVYEDLESGGMS